MSTLVYIVRHGESEANAGPVRQGPESRLTEKGRREAEMIARRCAALHAEALIVSPYVRARETAEPVSRETGLPIEYSDLFAERRNPSVVYGVRHDDPVNIAANEAIRENFATPDWRHSDEENFDDLKQRAGEALSFLESRPEKSLIVVSHGMFARILMARVVMGERLTGDECERFIRALRMNNTGLSVLRYDGTVEKPFEGAENPWKIIVWNDHSHLGDF